MSKVSITKSKLDRLANVISAKSGESIPLTIDEMEDAVRNIHPNLTSKTITENNSTYYAQDDDVDGYSSVTVAVDSIDCPTFTIILDSSNNYEITSITCDKTYEQCDNYLGEDNWNAVVKMTADGEESFWGAAVNGEDSTPTMTAYSCFSDYSNIPFIIIKYYSDGHIEWERDPIPRRYSYDLTVSGPTVTAPNGYYPSDASATVASGSATTPATTITANPTISVGSDGLITSNVSGSQSVTPTVSAGYVTAGTAGTVSVTGTNTSQLSTQAAKTVTPTESEQTAVAAGKYTIGAVKVGAISSTYVGSGIDQNDSTDLTASGATVTAPAGYYAQAASKSVASGSATTPATTITANPTISVGSDGLITATASATQSVTPTVSAGYVSSGSAGTITVSGSKTSQLSTQAGKTVTPTESEQTAVAAGKYTTGAVKVGAISSTYVGSGITQRDSTDLTASGATVTVPAGYYSSQASKAVASGTTGTPTATKGTVSNHSVSVTPSVTNTTGYITGGTTTGTAVTVSASELVAGNLSITENGTNIDVTNYSTVSVDVPTVTGGGVTQDQDGFIVLPPDGSGGGGGGGTSSPVPKKQINFVDYDGTILYSYTKTEWQSVSALPSNPTHSGLTSQGWNWTKAQIDAQLTSAPDADVWVGQMYITTSGDTKIDVRFVDSARLSPILAIYVNGTITVDWGDNTTANTVTGTSLTIMQDVPHTYASVGNYTITIHVVSGSFQFYGTNTYPLLRKNATINENRVYANCVQAVWLGSGVTSIGNYAFYNCCSLVSITIPNSVTSIGIYVFYNCYSLANITIPSNVTSIGTYAFYNCYSLASITIPNGVTSIEDSAFYNCCSLASITIPNSVTSIGSYAFYDCYSLANITIPSNVTSIGSYAFGYCNSLASITIPNGVTSIGNYMFYRCYSLASITILSDVTSIGSGAFSSCNSLASITIPSSVTNIGTNTFDSCYGMAEYHIKATTPPTLGGTNSFNNIVSDCVIYVPSASLSDYQTASNWSTYASYMQGE